MMLSSMRFSALCFGTYRWLACNCASHTYSLSVLFRHFSKMTALDLACRFKLYRWNDVIYTSTYTHNVIYVEIISII